MENKEYLHLLDSLRAVAVTLVLIYHLDSSILPGGYLGVDVFFVLSGFLITHRLKMKKGPVIPFLIEFYRRRLLRLAPMSILVLACAFGLAYFLLPATDFYDFAEIARSIMFFSANIVLLNQADYFDALSELKPLVHYWSLSLEEQFYLIYPALFFLPSTTYWRKRFIVIAAFASLITYIFLESYGYDSSAFYLPLSRSWELLAGGLLAYVPIISLGKKLRLMIRCLAILVIIILTIVPNYFDYSSAITLVSIVLSTLLFVYVSQISITSPVNSILSISFYIGKISYGLYLWHQVLFAFARFADWDLYYATLVTLLLSILTYHIVETPLRQKKISLRKAGLVYIILSIPIIGLSNLVVQNDGMVERPVNSKYSVYEYQSNNRLLQEESRVYFNHLLDSLQRIQTQPEILIIGNSHAKDLAATLYNTKNASRKLRINTLITQISDYHQSFNKIQESQTYSNADTIIICSRYKTQDIMVLPDLVSRLGEIPKTVILVKEIHASYNEYNKTIPDTIIQYMVMQNSDFDYSIVTKIRDMCDSLYKVEYLSPGKDRIAKRKAFTDSLFHYAAYTYSNIHVLDRMDYVCPNGDCSIISDDLEKFFYDYGHNTVDGYKHYAKIIDEIDWLKLD